MSKFNEKIWHEQQIEKKAFLLRKTINSWSSLIPFFLQSQWLLFLYLAFDIHYVC